MEKKIEIKGEKAEELSPEYFRALFDEYSLRGIDKVGYEPVKDSGNRGIVTVTGDFNLSDVYTVLSRKFIIKINTETKGKNLEDRLGNSGGSN